MNKTSEPGSEEWTREQVEEFIRRFPKYNLFAEKLEDVLRKAAEKHAPLAIVQTRPKSVASFAEKCQRKAGKYKDPVNQITDLCGGRVIVHTADEVRAMSVFIKQHFEIDEENSVDVSERLKPTEFGYRSVHYVVRFKPGVFPSGDVKVELPPELLDDRALPNRKAEIQVRTFLEHAWAAISHDMAYKSSFEMPAKWEREFASVAAALEGADKSFSRILEGLRVYASSYGAYMTEKQMRDSIGSLEVVLEYDPRNAGLAGRIGRLAITLGDWDKAIEVLQKFADPGNPAILRDLGVAIYKKHKSQPRGGEYAKGQRYLEMACESPDGDAAALSSLADSWKGVNDDKAQELCRRAFHLAPDDPNPLESYLDMKIASAKDTSIVPLLSHVIASAIRKCQDQVEVGVNLPGAFYTIGKFHLLLNEPCPPFPSFEAYAKAVQLSPSPSTIETALDSLERLKKASGGLSGYEWARRLLLIGRAVTAERRAREAREAVEKATDTEDKARKAKNHEMKATEAEEAKKEILKLASQQVQPIRGPVVIVAGGCDPSIEEKMKSYRDLVLEGFEDFDGTIIGGGTREGISGLVGEVGEKHPETIWTMTYRPSLIPADATMDERYREKRFTEGKGFSLLEPLQNWIDIMASGLAPSEVTVFGINGGPIAAMEYRIALALGATVGIVAGSGREGSKLLRDERWETPKRLIDLPEDAMTVKAFIGLGGCKPEAPGLGEDIRETLAREIHEEYRRSILEGKSPEDRALADWKDLAPGLKESNKQQADHIRRKLRQIGCDWRNAPGRVIALFEFTSAEVEKMAEMEHGRWNAERLLDGWTMGDKKDLVKKTSPFLVGWSALPEDIKERDRITVRKIPAFMKKIGLEIFRLPEATHER